MKSRAVEAGTSNAAITSTEPTASKEATVATETNNINTMLMALDEKPRVRANPGSNETTRSSLKQITTKRADSATMISNDQIEEGRA